MATVSTPSAMISLAQIRELEEYAAHAWPARHTAMRDGWMLRTSDGHTKRANSASPLSPSADFSTLLPAIETHYVEQGLPPLFRLTDLATFDTADRLRQAGYAPFEPSWVLLRDLSPTTAPSGIIVEPAPTATWLATLAHAAGLTERARRGHADILSRIETPCAFATRYADGRPVGVGLAVLQQGHVGLFELAVAAPNRHQGHAQALMHTLCNWGYARNAQHAYLQVLADNLAAMRLYDQLGFAKAYRYDYWRRG